MADKESGEPGAGTPEPSFEQALERLEAAVTRLESGELSLDDALAAFEEGVRMARLCRARLQQAEESLRVLVEQDGAMRLLPFGPGPEVTRAPAAGDTGR